jgi:ectoine hydroxylase-related dioxygenase (phytanoyl-CoA dioxygenase family)
VRADELEIAPPWPPAAVAATYRAWGCCLLRGLLRDHVADVRAELAGMVAEVRAAGLRSVRNALIVERSSQGRRRQIMLFSSVHEVMASVRNVVEDRRLLALLRLVLQGAPELFASMCPYKEAHGGMAKGMHQDAAYYLHRDHSLLNCFVHLVPTSERNGCLRIVPGSFRMGLQEHFDSPSHLAVSPRRFPFDRALPIRARPGDVLLFNYLTLHGSLANHSARDRPALALQFRARGDVQRWQSSASTETLGRPWRRRRGYR